MKRLSPLSLLLPAAAFLLAAPRVHARVDSEVSTVDKRHAEVAKAEFYSKPVKPTALSLKLTVPFAPPSFDLTDDEEAAAARAAAAANQGTRVAAGPTDHELLTEIVAKVRPSGTAYIGGKPLLMFGSRFVKTGAHFTVTYKGTDYDLELTQIDGTNFTLRYKSDEITRPILAAQPKTK